MRLARLLTAALFIAFGISAQDIAHESEREQWQHINDIFAAMDIHPSSVVADIGAGDGFLTVRLSALVGASGHVYAEDIAEKRMADLHKRVDEAHLSNVSMILGAAGDPKLPTGQLDAVIILNAYHEIEPYQDMLRHIYDALKPGGRLVISEPSPLPGEETRAQQIVKHHIASAFVRDELMSAGFTVVESREKSAHIPDGPIYYSLVTARR
ncbi:MAG TPA: methyltransferase domain-containing protein [Bryobacteraceae bacterium]|nr:methyltransferase domain-containing protein [Bryobacteraceae bacterium]